MTMWGKPPSVVTSATGGPPPIGPGPYVVGLGGGHGLAVTLEAARRYAGRIAAVVSVADNGGSSGRLREELGMPAPGDVRRCLVALAAEPAGELASAFGRRFETGALAGHPLGNLVIASLWEGSKSFEQATAAAGRALGVCGSVYPATADPVTLTATVAGRPVSGQTSIEAASGPIEQVAVDPPGATPPASVLTALDDADQIVLGPGSLFTSVLAVACVPAIRQALERRRGGVVFVCNLKPSRETVDFDVAEHVAVLDRHGIRPDVVLADTAGIAVGRLPAGAPEVVKADLGRPDGWAHDPGRLAEALSSLATPRWPG
jgi:uncharacterized cofD-like protein